jgi:osmoprotectant transport system permease protein
MLSVADLFSWLGDSANWDGRYGLWNLLAEHLALTVVSLLLAAIVAIPLGFYTGHTGRGDLVVLGLGSLSRSIPTMGLLFALVLLMGVQYRELSVVIALVAIAVPPILAGTHAGVTTIPAPIRDAATAQGMTTAQVLRYVEIPLSLASIVGGVRIAFIQVVSTIVIAPLVGLGGLGFGIVQGLAVRDYAQVLASSLVIIATTVIGDQLLGWVQRRTGARLVEHQTTEKT